MMAFVKALLAALGACAAAAPLRAPTDKPNVVLIYADDLGFGDPGFNGHPTNDSPHLDALRARGKRITTWYSGCPVCTGSRASLMTGRVYSRVGVPGVFGGTSQTGLPLSEVTLADQFKTAGYATAAVGKWHLGQRAMYLPASRGFDEYLGIPFSDDMGAGRYSPCGKGGARGERGARGGAPRRARRAAAEAAAPRPRPSTPRRRRRASSPPRPRRGSATPRRGRRTSRTATRRTRRARRTRTATTRRATSCARRAAARRVARGGRRRRVGRDERRRAAARLHDSRRSTRAAAATRAGRG